MTDPALQMHLMAILVVTIIVLLLWNQFRRRPSLSLPGTSAEKYTYKQLRRVSHAFWLIFFAFTLMIIVYAALPEFYFVFIPIDAAHHPLINAIGLLIAKVAIAWLVVAQLQIDKELFKYSRNIESLPVMELVWYSEQMLLTGMLVFFLGIFITITNIIGLILTLTGLVIYLRRKIRRPD